MPEQLHSAFAAGLVEFPAPQRVAGEHGAPSATVALEREKDRALAVGPEVGRVAAEDFGAGLGVADVGKMTETRRGGGEFVAEERARGSHTKAASGGSRVAR